MLFAHHGNIRYRHLGDQAVQAACLSLVVNCVAAWNAKYLGEAVEQLRANGFSVADDDIAHLGPTMCEHTNVHGRYHFNLGQPPKSLPDPAPQQDAYLTDTTEQKRAATPGRGDRVAF